MDFGSLFSAWSAAAPAAASAASSSGSAGAAAIGSGVHLEGLLCSASASSGGALIMLRIRPAQQPESSLFLDATSGSSSSAPVPMLFSVSVRRDALQMMGEEENLGPLDMIRAQDCFSQTSTDGRHYVHARSVVRLRTWREMASDAAFMASELIPLPLPADGTKSAPFVVYSGAPGNDPQHHVKYNTVPGFFRKWVLGVNDEILTTGNDQYNAGQLVRRLTYKFEQRQWRSLGDARPDMEVLHLQVTLWDAQCRRLAGDGLGDLNTWSAIMRSNCIPFYAVVVADGMRGGFIRLSAIGIRWMLREYLEQFCIELTAAEAASLLPTAPSSMSSSSSSSSASLLVSSGGEDGAVINLSAAGHMPPVVTSSSSSGSWRFYALSANGAAESAADLTGYPLVVCGVRSPPSHAPRATSATAAVVVDDNNNEEPDSKRARSETSTATATAVSKGPKKVPAKKK